WVFERRPRLIHPEQFVVDDTQQVLPLEPLRRLERCRADSLGLGAHLLEAIDFLLKARGAPVGHLAVELMASSLHREERVTLEVALDECGDKLIPGGARGGGRIRARRRSGSGWRLARASCGGDEDCSHGSDGSSHGNRTTVDLESHEHLVELGTEEN